METTLQVNQTNGRLNLNIKPPKMSLETKSVADFKISQQSGKIKVSTKDAKVEISGRKVRAALGHKHYKVYGKELAQKGKQSAMKGIAKYARQGDQLAKIENGGNPLARQAKLNSQDPERKIGLKWKPGPEIKSSPPQFKVDYTRSQLKSDSKSYWPQGELDWGEIRNYLNPEPKFEVQAVDVKA
jgi:energy-converting hydrogenase Eha subunit F